MVICDIPADRRIDSHGLLWIHSIAGRLFGYLVRPPKAVGSNPVTSTHFLQICKKIGRIFLLLSAFVNSPCKYEEPVLQNSG